MSIGMSWQDYWYGDPLMARDYYEAERIRQKRQIEQINSSAHLMGLYIYEALCDVSPVLHAFAKKGTKPTAYRTEPYPLTAEDKKELAPAEKKRREEAEIQRARAYMMQMDMVGKHWATSKEK